MTVLVTGAAGTIGAAVVRRLGSDATPAYRPGGRVPARTPGGAVAVDVQDVGQVRALFAALRPSTVVHAAATRGPDGHVDAEREVAGVRAVLDAAADAQVAHVVLFGSASEYGRAAAPMREDGPSLPTTPHGAAKAAGVAAARERAAQEGAPAVSVLRPFHVVGRGDPPHHLVPRALAAVHGGPPLPVVQGEAVRDLVHVDDVVDAVVAAVARPVRDALPVNVCSGVAVQVRDVLALLGELLGRAVPTSGVHARTGFDEERRVGDPGRALALWGWRAAGPREALERCMEEWPWAR